MRFAIPEVQGRSESGGSKFGVYPFLFFDSEFVFRMRTVLDGSSRGVQAEDNIDNRSTGQAVKSDKLILTVKVENTMWTYSRTPTVAATPAGDLN
jgi:hypothetical protein